MCVGSQVAGAGWGLRPLVTLYLERYQVVVVVVGVGRHYRRLRCFLSTRGRRGLEERLSFWLSLLRLELHWGRLGVGWRGCCHDMLRDSPV